VPEVLVPSPQVMTSLVMSFPASVQFPDALTVSGAVPDVGVTVKVQLGVELTVTETVCGVEDPEAPLESVALSTILKFPAVV
jgi:hypothetical protein